MTQGADCYKMNLVSHGFGRGIVIMNTIAESAYSRLTVPDHNRVWYFVSLLAHERRSCQSLPHRIKKSVESQYRKSEALILRLSAERIIP
jgi:hypothetical protein